MKRWKRDEEEPAESDAGTPALCYHVRWRKGTAPGDVIAAVYDGGAPFVVHAEIS